MTQAEVTLIASNSAEFPAGSRVWAHAEGNLLTKLAGYEVEDTTYFLSTQRVHVRVALGYLFTISTTDYHRLVAE